MCKNVLVFSDLSCVGKCSISVALPILSCCGIETSIIPSTLLSAQTAFDNYFLKNLDDEISSIILHLKVLNLKFDAIYIGYLSSLKQIEIAKLIIKEFKKLNTIILVDPVMGDNGKLYSGFDDKFVDKIKELILVADYITPNITEAMFLSNESELNLNLQAKLLKLSKNIVITGINENNATLINAYNAKENYVISNTKFKGIYHGCGDVFASSLLACLLNNFSFYDSVKISSEFCNKCIENTFLSGRDTKYGLLFEKNLVKLALTITKNKI